MPPAGITPRSNEASLATAMIDQSAALTVLADHSKIGAAGRYSVAAAAQTDAVLTNVHAGNVGALDALREAGVEVVAV